MKSFGLGYQIVFLVVFLLYILNSVFILYQVFGVYFIIRLNEKLYL